MPLVQLIVLLVLAGIGLYVLNYKITMDATVKTIINWLVIIVIIIFLLTLFGIMPDLKGIRVGN